MNAQADLIHCREPGGNRVEISAQPVERGAEVLTPLALQLLASLHRRFNARRLELLAAREQRQEEFDAGALPDFLPGTAAVAGRDTPPADWRVAAAPADLRDRRVEIVGAPDRKTIINGLNAPAQSFIADFEDACSPTWSNLVCGQVNLLDAARGSITFADRLNGRIYRLREQPATLIVRPRGWHLPEKHVRIGGEVVAATLFDFALYVANNHGALARRGTAPYFYLPKLESHLEARLWNDVFIATQEALGLPRATIRATVLIETVLAAFEMDEILFELREHCVGLTCGRWDYQFSFIKKFRQWPDWILPDRNSLGMEHPFLRAYEGLLIKTCHRRGAYAIGGMSAQIPIRDDVAAQAAAVAHVRADKLREARAGHDGTWVAHPGLAPVARAAFDAALTGSDQLAIGREDVSCSPADLLRIPAGEITETGIRHCIRIGVQYIEAWLRGTGCVPLYNLMEDAATAEICRAQIWQWLRYGVRTRDGRAMSEERFDRWLTDELDRIHAEVGATRLAAGVFPTAARLFADMVKRETFDEFLTLAAYDYLP